MECPKVITTPCCSNNTHSDGTYAMSSRIPERCAGPWQQEAHERQRCDRSTDAAIRQRDHAENNGTDPPVPPTHDKANGARNPDDASDNENAREALRIDASGYQRRFPGTELPIDTHVVAQDETSEAVEHHPTALDDTEASGKPRSFRNTTDHDATRIEWFGRRSSRTNRRPPGGTSIFCAR